MKQNRISNTVDGISVVILYLIGSNLILGKFGSRDSWLIVLLGTVLALPMVYIYSAIIPKEKEKVDMMTYLDEVLGKPISKLVKICYLYYFFILNALVLRNYTEFIYTASLNQTPKALIMVIVMALCYIGAYQDLKLLGKFATYCFFILTVLLGFTVLLLLPQYNIDNILPIAPIKMDVIIKGLQDDITFPILESVAFIFILDKMAKAYCRKSRKVLFVGVILGGVFLAFYILISMLVLGELTYESTYFPIYRAMSRVDLLNFIQRLEVIPATSFILAGYFKQTICYYICCLIVMDIFKLKSYKRISTPIALIIVIMSVILFDGVISFFEWGRLYYWVFAIPFEFIFPLIIWFAVLFKKYKSYRLNK